MPFSNYITCANASPLINDPSSPPMDPPPQPPMFPNSNSNSDSANSSPRSRPDTAWDDHSLPPVPGAKLRLMCSYGGHIIPRPHDKSLCYVGGDTRIVVVDRHSSMAELHSRLSHTLLNGRHFTLKYQLPSEDLDSLISLATDEDLENMIEEYDRTTAASPLNPSRLRLFLFPSKPETAASMGSLLDDAKSETWFVDALNGSGLLPRGLSESTAIDTLLELNHGGIDNSDSCTDLVSQNDSNNKQVLAKSNVIEAAMDSPPMVETSSSFGSTSSSPSMANLPPIKVRGEDYLTVGLDEQFSHVCIAPSLANVAPPPVNCVGVAAVKPGGENRVICDDEKSEKSDHGTMVAPTGLRKPPLPLPLQPVQRKLVDVHNLPSPDSKHAGGYNLASPDSVASIASSGSLSKHAIYQDATRVSTPGPDPKITAVNIQEPISHPADPIPPPYQNQPPQFIPNSTHYVPISSYYPMYLHPPTQQPERPQYPMYVLPPQPPTTRPQTPPTKLDMAAGVAPMLVQVPAHQFQPPHYIGLPQIPQATAQPGSGCGGGSASAVVPGYGYEYSSHHVQDQAAYYAQAAAAPPPQYHTMTPAAAVMYSQASTQLPSDNTAQQ